MSTARIEFVRLVEVPLAAIVELLNEPRNSRHMPLSASFTPDSAREWVAEKDRQWEGNGYGPSAVLVNGELAGWGGFQREPNGAGLALVLAPRCWGHGFAIARVLLDRGFAELGLTDVIITLPYSRRPDRVVARFGFHPDGEVTYDGVAFRQYRLTRADWSAAGGFVGRRVVVS